MNLINLKEKLLIFLAQSGAYTRSLNMSTSTIAQHLGTSQQSASRILIQLEQNGYIEKIIVGKTTLIRLTNKGLDELKNLYIVLKSIFEKPVEIILEGRVFSGLGEGFYYISLPQYFEQIKEKVGFTPYPGTLNIQLLSKDSIENRMLLEKIADIPIDGFSNGQRTYGGAKCIRALFNGEQEAALIFVERTHYGRDVVEVIAPVYLRGKYNLRDGDKVFVKVTLKTSTLNNNILAAEAK
jgi:riboflavin kinase